MHPRNEGAKQITERAGANRLALPLLAAPIAAEVGNSPVSRVDGLRLRWARLAVLWLVCRVGRAWLLGSGIVSDRALPRLLLAPLEVFTQRRGKPCFARVPRIRLAAGFAAFRHSVTSKHAGRCPAISVWRPASIQARSSLARECPLWQGSPRPSSYSEGRASARACCRSSVVEHSLGKGEVVSSILTGSTRVPLCFYGSWTKLLRIPSIVERALLLGT
jgi:hypothetical protein